MPSGRFTNVRVASMAAAVPTKTVMNESFATVVGEETARNVVQTTGIRQFQQARREQTASDLGFAAAEQLLEREGIDRNEIGAILNATETPDYETPSTAFILQHRLGLSPDCMAFDINLGCTGWVYGIHLAASLLQAMTQRYVLLIVGNVYKLDNLAAREKPDHSFLMLFGDSGTATLVERKEDSLLRTRLWADGSGYSKLITPGGTRNADASTAVSTWSDGFDRTLQDPYMDGLSIFAFSTSKAPKAIKTFLSDEEETLEDYDRLILHQANKMILDLIAKRIKADPNRVPVSLDRFGNTFGGSIPMTIVDSFGEDEGEEPLKLLTCGYGVGLSWGVVALDLVPAAVLPLIYTDDYWAEGRTEPF